MYKADCRWLKLYLFIYFLDLSSLNETFIKESFFSCRLEFLNNMREQSPCPCIAKVCMRCSLWMKEACTQILVLTKPYKGLGSKDPMPQVTVLIAR